MVVVLYCHASGRRKPTKAVSFRGGFTLPTNFKSQRANDPCACRSGMLYKRCHKVLHRAPPKKYLETARKFYFDRWAVNAASHAKLGHYDWMIDQLPGGARRVLDIGIGNGAGVQALLRRLQPDVVIALEENPFCIRKARQRLETTAGLVALVERLATPQIDPDDADYRSEIVGGQIPTAAKVTIVLTDPLFDRSLAEDLSSTGPFDLVTGWLIGSHEARENSVEIQSQGISSATEYRLFVQNVVYEIADRVLRPGGVLQLVDRIQHPDLEKMREDLLRSHAEQAEGTTLQVRDVSFTPYQEAPGGRVTLISEKTGEIATAGVPMYLASIVAVKSESHPQSA
jgi:SAM-dependent methyltransferase